MTNKRKDCPMRHENGNCTVAGGFCTAVNNPICEALHNAFACGYRSALRHQEPNDWICTLKCTALMDEGMCSHGGLCCLYESQRTIKENQPLTMEELRKMDGEPVWVSVSNNWRESGVSEGWCIVRFHSEDDRVRVYVYDTRHGARFFAQQDYGESWLAYRQKPEEWTL